MKTYVDWAAKQGFAVIDVNLPKHITVDEEDSQQYEAADAIDYRTREATHLLSYLFDNYIDLNDSTHVFLLGTNTGHGAIVNWIKQNEERAQERLTKAISFVEDVPLQSCKSATSDELAKWYYNTSLVFVAAQHNFWASDYARKIKKRFGHVFKSPEDHISDMLVAHKEPVTAALLADTAGWKASWPTVEDEDIVSSPEPRRKDLLQMGGFGLSSPAKNFEMSSGGLPKMPPISNFASPSRRGAGSPRIGSPPKSTPPVANFALSPGQRLPRSPAR